MRIHLVPIVAVLASVFPHAAANELPAESKRETGPHSTAGSIDSLWSDLAEMDAGKAYRAIWALTNTPKETVSHIARQLKPAVAPDPRKVERLIEDLNSETFAVRDKANLELTKLGGLVESALRKALIANPALEGRQRAEKLVNRLLGPITIPDHLRGVRAVETLEYIATGEAKWLLTRYAGGAPGARLTQDAQEALERLDKAIPFTPWREAARTDLYGDPLPVGAIGRLGTIRYRRTSGESFFTKGLAFLPDGKAILEVNEADHHVRVWEVPSGLLVRTISTGPMYIRGFALAPDAKQFAVAGIHPFVGNGPGASGIRVYSVSSGRLLRTFPRKSASDHWDLAFAPDGKLLFSLDGREGIVRIEDIASGKELAQHQFPPDNQARMTLSHDGVHLAVAYGYRLRKYFLWEWEKGELRALENYGLHSIIFSRDGKSIVGINDGALCVLQIPSGKLLYERKPTEKGVYVSLSFSPDGKALAVMLHKNQNPEKIDLFDPATGRRQGTLALNRGSGLASAGGLLAISGDSRTLAMPAGMGLRFWDLASQKELSANDQAHETEPRHILVSPKGFLVTASYDGSVRVWDAATTKQRRKFTVTDWVNDIALSPDGDLLAAAISWKPGHVWETHTGKEVHRLAGDSRQSTLGFLPDGQGLVSMNDDLSVQLWDIKMGAVRHKHTLRPQGFAIPDKNMEERRQLFERQLGEARITPDRKTLVLPFGDAIHLFDAMTGKQTSTFPSEFRLMHASTTVSPDSKYLLSSGLGDDRIGNHPVILWDLASGRIIQRHLQQGFTPGAVAFAADGRMFATAVHGPNEEILLYETASGNVRGTIRGFRGTARSLAFFPDGRRLASGLSDSTVLLWDLTR